ncbi:phage tail protein I, partial [Sphingomonas trueperi]|uniref:phage tail protein I n=1 Tax=Sphingomonas trueperi TaxID=53317 RepID=UPI0031D13D73
PELLDPQRSPPAVLPYLADDRGVNEWDTDAPTAEKRLTVGSAWATQRLAGTRAALELVVESLGFESELIAWHQQEPRGPAYTLIVNALSRADSLTEELQARLWLRLEQAKAERDSLAVKILRLVLGTTTRPAVSHGGFVSTLSPLAITRRAQRHAQYVSISTIQSVRADSYPQIARQAEAWLKSRWSAHLRCQIDIEIYPLNE